MPNMRDLSGAGCRAATGLPGVPANPGLLDPLATALAGKHGSTNNPSTDGTDFSRGQLLVHPGLQADSIASPADGPGGRSPSWMVPAGGQHRRPPSTSPPSSRPRGSRAPTTPTSRPARPASASTRWPSRAAIRGELSAATRTDLRSRPDRGTTFAAHTPGRVYDVTFRLPADNRRAYDRVLLVPEAAGKDAPGRGPLLDGRLRRSSARRRRPYRHQGRPECGLYVTLTDLAAEPVGLRSTSL